MADNNLITGQPQPHPVQFIMDPNNIQPNTFIINPVHYQQMHTRQPDIPMKMVKRQKQLIFTPELIQAKKIDKPQDNGSSKSNFLFPNMDKLVNNSKKIVTQMDTGVEISKIDTSVIEKKVSKTLEIKPKEVAPKPVPEVVPEVVKEELAKKRIKYPRDLLIKLKTDKVTKELLFKLKPNGGNRRIDIDLGSVNLEKVEKPFIPSKNQNGSGETSTFESSVGILLNQIMPNNIQETHDKIEHLCDRSDENYEKFAKILFNSAIKQAKFCHLFSELSSLFKEVPSFRKTVITSCQKMLEKSFEDIIKDANQSVDDELKNINDENTRMIFEDNRESVVAKFKENYFGNVRFYAELFKSDMISLVIFKKEFMKLAHGDRLTVKNAETFLIIYNTADSIIEKKISKEQLNEFFQKLKTLVDNSPDIESHIRFKINDVIDKRISTKKKSDQSLNITEKTNLMPNQTWTGGLSNPSKASCSWATSINKERTNSLTTSSRPSEPIVTVLKKKSVTAEADLERNYLQLFEDNDADYESYLESLKKNNVNCQKIVANSLQDAMEKREPRRVACGKFLGHTLSKNLLASSDIIDGFCDYLLTIDEDWYENYPCGMDYLGFILGHMMKHLGEGSDKLEIISKIADKAVPGENSDWTFGLQLIGKTVSNLNKIEAKEIIGKIPNLTKSLETQIQKSSTKDLQKFLKECDIHQLVDNIPDQLPHDARKPSIPSNSMSSSTSSINNTTKTILKPPSHNQPQQPAQPTTTSMNQTPGQYASNNNSSYQQQQPPQQKSLNPMTKKSMPNPHNPKQASLVNATKVSRSNSYKQNIPTNANVVNSNNNKGPISRNTTDHRPHHRNDHSTEHQSHHYNDDGFQKQMSKKQRNKNLTKNNNYNNRSESNSKIDEILSALTRKDNDEVIRLMKELMNDDKDKISEDFIRKFSSIVYRNVLNLPKSEMEKSVEILRVIESDSMGRNHKVLLSELQLHSDHENIKNLVSTLVSNRLLSIESVNDWYTEEPWLTEKYQTLHSVVASLGLQRNIE